MSLPNKTSRTLQLVTLAMLFTSFAQIAYWIVDEAMYMERVLAERLDGLERARGAAQELLAAGRMEAQVAARFPELVVEAGEARVPATTVAELHEARRRRLIRYGSEGTFLLVVFVAGIATLTHTLKQPAELLRRQENFVAAVSHEFKTPLASLKLSAETLLLRDLAQENQRVLADRMVQDVERLESMVTNVLEAGTIAEGRLTLDPEDLPLAPALAPLVQRRACRAHLSGVEVESEVGPELAVRCDRNALAMVLDNLLGNAVKSVAAKGGGRVRVGAARDGRRVRLEVTDDGLGFDPREASRLFEKFYRPGDELQRRTRGSGLGLHVVRTLVEASGGEVVGESEGEGRGATFRLWLPAAEGAAA